jgi:hypothetical protein
MWSGVFAVIVVAFVVGVKALPGGKEPAPEHFSRQKAVDVNASNKPVKVTRRDRAGINATLDGFVPAAMARRHPIDAYRFSTPNLRHQATLREWRTGDIPVHPFPARGRTFHGWVVNYAIRNHVNLDLLVMPRLEEEKRPIAFTIDMRRIHGRWLVDAVLPIAVFAPLPPQGNRGPVISTNDLVPGTPRGGALHSRVSWLWAVVPFSLVGLGLLSVLFLLVGRGMLQDRKLRKHHKSLPPLPSSRSR